MSSMMSYDHYIDLQMIIDHAPMLYSLTNFVPDFQQQITFPFMYKVPLWIFRREKTKRKMRAHNELQMGENVHQIIDANCLLVPFKA